MDIRPQALLGVYQPDRGSSSAKHAMWRGVDADGFIPAEPEIDLAKVDGERMREGRCTKPITIVAVGEKGQTRFSVRDGTSIHRGVAPAQICCAAAGLGNVHQISSSQGVGEIFWAVIGTNIALSDAEAQEMAVAADGAAALELVGRAVDPDTGEEGAQVTPGAAPSSARP